MKSGGKSVDRCKGHIKNCKRRGEWSELQFMARAAREGLRIAKPWGDSSRYDVVVVCGVHPSPNSELYKRGDFDFLAAYLIFEDVWFIIPGGVIVRPKRNSITLYADGPDNRWTDYKEAWDLLRNHRRRH
jgi:hypothetical protein